MPELKKIDLNQPAAPAAPQKPAVANNQQSVSSPMSPSSSPKKLPIMHLVLVVVVILFGLSTGYGISRLTPGKTAGGTAGKGKLEQNTKVAVGDVFGVEDDTTFSDTAEGVLEKGGIKGEGTHHLLRPGGDSQSVYLTSSVVDLDALQGHKIKVWGQTFTAQTAGWLMDVGKVQVLELDAQKPE